MFSKEWWFVELAAIAGTPAYALEWSSTNIQLLHGSGYQLGDSERTIFTLEHANR